MREKTFSELLGASEGFRAAEELILRFGEYVVKSDLLVEEEAQGDWEGDPS